LTFFVLELQGMSSSAPIVPTKVLGDPEELEKHLTMLQNGFNAETYAVAAVAVETDQTVDPNGILNINVGGANGVDINSVPPSLKEYGDRFIFAPPTVELERSEVQLHASVGLLSLMFLFFAVSKLVQPLNLMLLLCWAVGYYRSLHPTCTT
jgi:hypothetical protein